MKLTYWYSQCPNDSDVYSVRARTKKQAILDIAQMEQPGWPAPKKVTVQYHDAFSFLQECSSEGHHWWEAK